MGLVWRMSPSGLHPFAPLRQLEDELLNANLGCFSGKGALGHLKDGDALSQVLRAAKQALEVKD